MSHSPEVMWLELGGLRQRVLRWATAHSGPAMLLLHGWLDLADSFCELVPFLQAQTGIGSLYALDFRGHGHSEWIGRGGYYHFQDYLRDVHDLTRKVGELSQPFHLVGHSMGGTVATYTAGSFPEKVRSLTLLEGTGPRGLQPEQSPERSRRWMTQLTRRVMPARLRDLNDAFERLQAAHPQLPELLLRRMAGLASVATDEGRRWRYDPLHRTQSPVPFTSATYISYARAYPGPVLHVYGDESWMYKDRNSGRMRREAAFAGEIERHVIAGAGHMLHLSHAGSVAAAMECWRHSRSAS